MRTKHKYLIGLVVLLGALFLLFWPLPDYIEAPGGANNLAPMVKISHHPDRDRGQFMLTSVAMAPAHPLTYCWAKLDPQDSVEGTDGVTGGQNNRVFNRVQQFYMRDAINEAIYTAFKAAHRPVKNRYHGIYVVGIMKRSHFRRALRVGDTITKINSHHFNSALGYQRYLALLPFRSRVRIQYRNRFGRNHATKNRLIELPDHRSGIGVILTDNASVKSALPVHVNSEKIGGPSGGLMFTLQMYDQLTSGHLKRGRKIAGTGTINRNGQIGEIGGIDKKVIAAHRRGAKIFFAPYVKPTRALLKYEPHHLTNYQQAVRTAHKYAPHMKIIPVTNFRGALADLR